MQSLRLQITLATLSKVEQGKDKGKVKQKRKNQKEFEVVMQHKIL